MARRCSRAGAGSGESNIRRWIIENDWLEAIIALPEQMLYNTAIGIYAWIVTNRKEKRRRGRIQLVDARELWTPGGSAESRRSLGYKRRHLAQHQIDEIVRLYGRFEDEERCKSFRNIDFGYTRVTVERPLRLRYQMTLEGQDRFLYVWPELLDDVQAIDRALGREPRDDWNVVLQRIDALLRERRARWRKPQHKLFREAFTAKTPQAAPVRNDRGDAFEPDPALRDFENVPLTEDIDVYFAREVLSHVSDAWMDRTRDKVGVRNQLQPPLLQVHAVPPAGRNRRGPEAGGREDHPVAAGNHRVSSVTDVPLRHVFHVTSGGTPSNSRADFWDGEILWITPEDLSDVAGYWLDDTRRKITDAGYESSGVTLAESKAIVLSKRAPIGLLAVLARAACSSQGCLLLSPNVQSRLSVLLLLVA